MRTQFLDRQLYNLTGMFQPPTWPHRWLPYGYADFVKAFFGVMGINLGQPKRGFDVDYNSLYGFYDVVLYEHILNGPRARRTHWATFEQWLKVHNFEYKKFNDAWRWEHNAEIQGAPSIHVPGVRFFITPKGG